MKKITLISLLLFVNLGFLFGQETSGKYNEVAKMNDWGFEITPYALIASQSTDVGGEKLRQSFSDLSSLTNAGFQIIAAARYKRSILSFDGTFATLGSDFSSSGNLVSTTAYLTIKQRILDLKLSYIVFDNFEIKNKNVIKGWALEVGVGAKYWSNDIKIDYVFTIENPLPGQNDKVIEGSEAIPQKWWDLMVGAKTTFVVTEKFKIVVMGNIGGFGIGNSSKFAYDFTYFNNLRVLDWLSVDVGFRNFYYKRIDDEGKANELTTKVNVLGPALGVTFLL
ncbi:MAG: hypothetical protein KAG64_00340 [Bacteroidales bacterium]|nr:hypothetical protein [Bacteroidales bacterium]